MWPTWRAGRSGMVSWPLSSVHASCFCSCEGLGLRGGGVGMVVEEGVTFSGIFRSCREAGLG